MRQKVLNFAAEFCGTSSKGAIRDALSPDMRREMAATKRCH